MYPYGPDSGVVNDAYGDYSRGLSRVQGAVVDPLLYPDAPDHAGIEGIGPFEGTIGGFSSHGAIAAPLGAYQTTYGGNLPTDQQPQVVSPDPWQSPELT